MAKSGLVVDIKGRWPISLPSKRLVDFYGHSPDRVQLCDYSEDVISDIGESDLMVMPSLSEGTPFALSEAMACGRPGVGTPVGGIPELLVEGETGWLARSTELADVADALERAWEQRPQWSHLGLNGQKKVAVSYNNQEHIIDELIKALLEDINQPIPKVTKRLTNTTPSLQDQTHEGLIPASVSMLVAHFFGNA